jgi:hypothetical protein
MNALKAKRQFLCSSYFVVLLILGFLIIPNKAQCAELNRSVISSQPENKSEKCDIRLPPRTANLPYKFTVEWDGACMNGFAQGYGSILAHYDGRLNSREIVSLDKGYRTGRGITTNLAERDVGYGRLVITNWRDGYVCGTMEEYDRSGKRMGAGEGRLRWQCSSNQQSLGLFSPASTGTRLENAIDV